jgi:flagellar assembly protein FliH
VGKYRVKDKELKKEKQNILELSNSIKKELTQDKDLSIPEKENLLKQLREEADEILKSSRKEAENIKKEARETSLKEGYQEGFIKGQSEGYKAGLEQLRPLCKTLQEVLEKARSTINKELNRLSADLIELSVKIASKIVNTSLEIKPELINNIVLEILSDVGNHEKCIIYLSPELINNINEINIKTFFPGQDIEFIADKNLKAGDCIIESGFGGRDATLDKKLEILEKALLEGADYHDL